MVLRYDGWRGLLIEPGKWFNTNLPDVICRSDFLTPGNIESVFKEAGVPEVLDFLSIDIDGNDYYLWEALNVYKPRVLLIEVDGYANTLEKLEPYGAESNGPKSSISMMSKLCNKKGYSLIYNNGSNAFYINDKDYNHYFKPLPLTNWNEQFVATVDLFTGE